MNIEEINAAKDLARTQAIKGDPICAAPFVLESIAHEMGLGFLATTAIDFSEDEEDEDIRPF